MFSKNDAEMQIIITSRHEFLTEALRETIEGRIHKVEKFLGKIKKAHIILNFEKRSHICEVNITAKGLRLSARGVSHDMYQSIDSALMKMERQVKKAKDKRVKHHAEPARNLGTVTHGVIPPFEEGEELIIELAKKYAVKPMSVEEAALQLADSRDEFLVFSNAETGHTNVVYKRKEKHIGLIEPEY